VAGGAGYQNKPLGEITKPVESIGEIKLLDIRYPQRNPSQRGGEVSPLVESVHSKASHVSVGKGEIDLFLGKEKVLLLIVNKVKDKGLYLIRPQRSLPWNGRELSSQTKGRRSPHRKMQIGGILVNCFLQKKLYFPGHLISWLLLLLGHP
jgi:hypothetical protein